MNKTNAAKRQKGFFDFGFSLAILAMSGAFAYATTPDEAVDIAAQQAQTEVVANLDATDGNRHRYE